MIEHIKFAYFFRHAVETLSSAQLSKSIQYDNAVKEIHLVLLFLKVYLSYRCASGINIDLSTTNQLYIMLITF